MKYRGTGWGVSDKTALYVPFDGKNAQDANTITALG